MISTVCSKSFAEAGDRFVITFEGIFYYSLRAFKFSLDTDHLNDSPLKFDGMLESTYVVSVGLSDPALASSAPPPPCTAGYLSSVSCLIAGYLSSAKLSVGRKNSRVG